MNRGVAFVHSRDGTRIAYSVTGDGPVLVKLAGPAASHIELYPQQHGVREYLAQLGHGRTLVRIDMRASGASDRNCADLSQAALADDVETVLDALAIDRFDLIAFGTRVVPALGVALRRATSLERLIAVSPIILPIQPGMLELMEANWSLYLEIATQRNARRPLHEVQEIVAFSRRCMDQRSHVAELKARRPADYWKQVEEVAVPVLVVETEGLFSHRPGDGPEMARRFPRGRFIQLPAGSVPPPAGDPQALLQAIHEFLGPPPSAATGDRARTSALTPREAEVLGWLTEGKTEREVAEALRISPATASRHVANLYTKLGVHRRAEAVAWAVRHGMTGSHGRADPTPVSARPPI